MQIKVEVSKCPFCETPLIHADMRKEWTYCSECHAQVMGGLDNHLAWDRTTVERRRSEITSTPVEVEK